MFQEIRYRKKRPIIVDIPFIGPFLIAVFIVLITKTYNSSDNSLISMPKYKEYFEIHKPMTPHEKPVNASYKKDIYPNNISRTLVTKEVILPNIYVTKTIGDVGKDAVIPSANAIQEYAKSGNAFLVQMKNVFVNNEGIVYANNVFYPGDCACHWRGCIDFEGKHFQKEFEYTTVDKAICITHEYGWFFAHWLIDFMPKFAIIPEDILLSSKIIITSYADFTINGLKFLGVKQSNIIAPVPDTAVFCRTLYTVEPIVCTKFNAYLLLNLRSLIVKKCKLDTTPATKYVFYNRENTDYRKFGNYNDILKSIKSSYPQYSWQNIKISGGIKDQAKLFNSIKVFVAMHGAAFANTLFMQPNSSVAEIMGDRWVDNYLWISAYAQVHHVVCRDMKVQWRESGSKNVIDTKTILQLVDVAIKSMESTPQPPM
ncbi:hypothetical protein TVAG_043490 [Trichomonas vaginalis G3]|uniref:Glycosyltransferase 61 catalytic domain-containing protein n=1 Tax=Trichomonas vaginalis (strain ATCC PRA-98 / G3) TaxID=412133 RepID=A2EV89_TRIV3|nr:protein of unknown function, DUF563 family [Trichomonas vaginalis G3]EAY03403.1 hypothetical protein TVAG_043490 [Trichomonas vaginalis G3]KAI5540183.1 protein of unknown function, DUF563 family [Trichomonas vaginalis G3]|eukprot:XP_001315626.1 hypothetical protein [Trichomonas vaginalis G3]